jgi:hypothetical protein
VASLSHQPNRPKWLIQTSPETLIKKSKKLRRKFEPFFNPLMWSIIDEKKT